MNRKNKIWASVQTLPASCTITVLDRVEIPSMSLFLAHEKCVIRADASADPAPLASIPVNYKHPVLLSPNNEDIKPLIVEFSGQ